MKSAVAEGTFFMKSPVGQTGEYHKQYSDVFYVKLPFLGGWGISIIHTCMFLNVQILYE